MTNTNARKQASYRERLIAGGAYKRVNTYLSANAKSALERLAASRGSSQRETLERLLSALAP